MRSCCWPVPVRQMSLAVVLAGAVCVQPHGFAAARTPSSDPSSLFLCCRLGGEVQLWLALAYNVSDAASGENPWGSGMLSMHTNRLPALHSTVMNLCAPRRALLQACGREEDCLETYRTLERSHPVPAIRRQATGLLYIMLVRGAEHSRAPPRGRESACAAVLAR